MQEMRRISAEIRKKVDAHENIRTFKTGDYVICYGLKSETKELKPIVDSYGIPKKYKVVASIDEVGFMQQLNHKGKNCGPIISMHDVNITSNEIDEFIEYYDHTFDTIVFKLDPDYADSIILGHEYDPNFLRNEKRNIWKDITNHNKKYKVNTYDITNIINIFLGCNTGTVFWSSVNGSYTVIDKKMETFNSIKYGSSLYKNFRSHKGPLIPVLVVLKNINGNSSTIEISPDYFWGKTLYTQKPRSYREIKS
jgi:hypothetical protein